MLSVLIPIYNHNVLPLVTGLLKQLRKTNVEFEIILLDDASEQQYRFKNAKLDFEPEVTYLSNLFNVGRAKVRNILVSKARFPYILFIDCDAAIAHTSYIANYIEELENHKDLPQLVINGGVLYKNKKPKDNRRLRWYYGIHREQRPADVRNQNPYASFTPFNVVMSKSIFSQFEFDEEFVTYGNEDTVFGYQLKQHQIPYFHIDNGLYHEGIDTNLQYLQKVESAIDNLWLFINSENPIVEEVKADVKLLRAYDKCKHLGLVSLLSKFYLRRGNKLRDKVANATSLFWLDVYKLSYFSAKVNSSSDEVH